MQKIEPIENTMDGQRFVEGSEQALWKKECK